LPLAVYRSKNGRKAKTSVKSEVYHNVYDRNLYGRTATEIIYIQGEKIIIGLLMKMFYRNPAVL